MNADSMERPGAAMSWRPLVSSDVVALAAAAFFSLACNIAFWRGYAAAMSGLWTSPLMTVALFLAILGINAIIMLSLVTRRTARPLLTVLFPVTAMAVYFMHAYGVYLDPDMVRNVVHTDSKESRELMTPGLIPWLVGYAVLPVLLLWRLRIKRRSLKKATLHRLLWGMTAFALTFGSLAIAFQPVASLMRNHRELRHLVTPGNYLVSSAKVAYEAVKGTPVHRIVGADARPAVPRGDRKPRLLVIVVGETVRAQSWGLSGYSRNTTPQLSRLGVVNYRDVSACGSSTEVSLPCMFSDVGRAKYDRKLIQRSDSVLHVLARAGVQVAWIDNQSGCKGVCRGLPFTSYAQAGDPALCDAERCLDEILVKGMSKALASGDQVIVLHQLGNHGPSYYARYPKSFRQFTPTCDTGQLGDCSRQAIVNAYDNAILYTDHVLATLIRRLESDSARDSAVLYVSDHGESLGEGNLYLHGVPYAIAPATQLKVPMTLWVSKGMERSRGLDMACIRARAQRPASHDNFFSSVLGFMDVRTGAYERKLDVFAGCTSTASVAFVGQSRGRAAGG